MKAAYPVITVSFWGMPWGGTFHQEQWQQDLINHVSIHTLNYRKVGEVSKNANGYYWHILK